MACHARSALRSQLKKEARARLWRASSARHAVGQHFFQAGGDGGRRRRIEQGIVASQHFGDGRIICRDHRRAAVHGFQHRQAEAFVQRREHEHRAGVVQGAQGVVVDAAGDDDFIVAEAGKAHLLAEAIEVADLVDDQLVAATQGRGQAGIGLQHAVEVLAVIAVAGIEHVGTADAQPLYRRAERLAVGQHAEMVVGRAGDVDDPFGRDAEDADGVRTRGFGDGQEQVDMLQACQAPPVPVGIRRYRVEVLGREQQGDKIVQDGHAQAVRQDGIRRDRRAALAPSFEGTRAQDRVGPDRLIGGLDHRRCNAFVFRVVDSRGAQRRVRVRREPSRRHQGTEGMAQFGGAARVQAVGQQAQFMFATRGGHGFGKRQGVAADAAVARFGLAGEKVEEQAQTKILRRMVATCGGQVRRAEAS